MVKEGEGRKMRAGNSKWIVYQPVKYFLNSELKANVKTENQYPSARKLNSLVTGH